MTIREIFDRLNRQRPEPYHNVDHANQCIAAGDGPVAIYVGREALHDAGVIRRNIPSAMAMAAAGLLYRESFVDGVPSPAKMQELIRA